MADMVLHLTEEENIVLSAPVLRRLTETKSGDACLLYLCLKQNRDAMDGDRLRETLGWDSDRFERVKRTLAAAGLIRLCQEPAGAGGTADLPAQPPERRAEYTEEDIARRIEGDQDFASLLREVERRLGPVTTMGVKTLLGLCEQAGLPYDVIYMLVNYCICRRAAQGGGRKLTMREIEKEGYRWAHRNLFTPAAVEAYLKKLQEQGEKLPQYMKALQLPERAPVPSEETYLRSWLEMGFPPETVAIAYDKTVLKCREFKWAYCNGILKKWHEKNLHTPDEVKNEKDAAQKAAAGKPGGNAPGKNAWMKQYN